MPEQFPLDPSSQQLSQSDLTAKRTHKVAPLPKLSQQARFPVSFYVVHHLPTNSYGSVIVGRTRGLACFTKPEFALSFSATMETKDNLIVEIYMEDAAEIASASTPRSGALILADFLDAPVVYRLKGRNRHV